MVLSQMQSIVQIVHSPALVHSNLNQTRKQNRKQTIAISPLVRRQSSGPPGSMGEYVIYIYYITLCGMTSKFKVTNLLIGSKVLESLHFLKYKFGIQGSPLFSTAYSCHILGRETLCTLSVFITATPSQTNQHYIHECFFFCFKPC